jgi:hypothetical protein
MKRVLVYVCGLVIYMTVFVVMAVNGSTLPWWVMAVAAIATGFLAERVAKPKAKTGGTQQPHQLAAQSAESQRRPARRVGCSVANASVSWVDGLPLPPRAPKAEQGTASVNARRPLESAEVG